MPPNLALFLGFALATFCILQAARAEGGFPLRLLWPSLFYLVCASRPFSIWMVEWNIQIPFISGLESEGSPMDQFFLLSLLLLGWRVLAQRSFSWPPCGGKIAGPRCCCS